MGMWPYDDPVRAIAPHVSYHAGNAMVAEENGDLGEAAKAVCGLYHMLGYFRKRDAFFLEEWICAGGPLLLALPEDVLTRIKHDINQVRAARLALFALLERIGCPFHLGYTWPYGPDDYLEEEDQ